MKRSEKLAVWSVAFFVLAGSLVNMASEPEAEITVLIMFATASLIAFLFAAWAYVIHQRENS